MTAAALIDVHGSERAALEAALFEIAALRAENAWLRSQSSAGYARGAIKQARIDR